MGRPRALATGVYTRPAAAAATTATTAAVGCTHVASELGRHATGGRERNPPVYALTVGSLGSPSMARQLASASGLPIGHPGSHVAPGVG